MRLSSLSPSLPRAQMKDSLVLELRQKAEETENLHLELQMLETERVRLSLVEEKLMDVLQLLQKLRDLVSQMGSTTEILSGYCHLKISRLASQYLQSDGLSPD